LPARTFLLVSDAAAPLVSGESPLGVVGLGRALVAAGGAATVVSLASPELAATVPGLARRLRTVTVKIGDLTQQVPLFEGKVPFSQAQAVVVGAQGRNRGESALLLAEAVRAMAEDGLLPKADAMVAWGETAALALSVSQSPARLFVEPSGRLGLPLTPGEIAVIEPTGVLADRTAAGPPSLSGIGAAFANAIVAPSRSAALLLESDPGLAERASDEPVVAVRFGCDDPPHDPASDPALPATFSAKALSGKAECRRAVTKRHSLAVGPKTLLLGCGALKRGKGGEQLLAALSVLSKLDVVILIPGEGDADLLERARRFAIQSPARLAILDAGEAQERLMRAASDAILCVDPDDRTGRAAGLAQRYGALPIALDAGASRDFLVDYDPRSATGSAILFDGLEPLDVEAAVQRAVALRADADGFAPLVQRIMETAPRWGQTVAAIEEICATFD